MTEPRVGRVAFALGIAGLLPQVAATGLIAAGDAGALYDLPYVFAFGYASLILSFLGGIWWGLAMRRPVGQGPLVALAVLPSLLPLALVFVAMRSWPWALGALGVAILLTLVVDRALTRTGEAPAGWMRLRVPLSLGLSVLTIAAGLL